MHEDNLVGSLEPSQIDSHLSCTFAMLLPVLRDIGPTATYAVFCAKERYLVRRILATSERSLIEFSVSDENRLDLEIFVSVLYLKLAHELLFVRKNITSERRDCFY